MDGHNANLPGPTAYMGNSNVLRGEHLLFKTTDNDTNIDKARDAVDPLSTLKFWTDPAQGKREVKQYVCIFAYSC